MHQRTIMVANYKDGHEMTTPFYLIYQEFQQKMLISNGLTIYKIHLVLIIRTSTFVISKDNSRLKWVSIIQQIVSLVILLIKLEETWGRINYKSVTSIGTKHN
jgi:hypothetical protein